jgi:hypothetical protein
MWTLFAGEGGPPRAACAALLSRPRPEIASGPRTWGLQSGRSEPVRTLAGEVRRVLVGDTVLHFGDPALAVDRNPDRLPHVPLAAGTDAAGRGSRSEGNDFRSHCTGLRQPSSQGVATLAPVESGLGRPVPEWTVGKESAGESCDGRQIRPIDGYSLQARNRGLLILRVVLGFDFLGRFHRGPLEHVPRLLDRASTSSAWLAHRRISPAGDVLRRSNACTRASSSSKLNALLEVERLDEVVVGARLQAFNATALPPCLDGG